MKGRGCCVGHTPTGYFLAFPGFHPEVRKTRCRRVKGSPNHEDRPYPVSYVDFWSFHLVHLEAEAGGPSACFPQKESNGQ